MGLFFWLFVEVCYLIALFLVGERTEVKQKMKSRVVCVFRFVVLLPRECER
jgi:hypothetical protein